MTKSFHPGRAAQNGLTAAVLAKGGFTSSEAGIEGRTGWAHVLSTTSEHAVGSVERAMTDADLDAKVRNLCDGVLPAARTRRLIDLCRNIEPETSARVIVAVARV